MTVDTKSKIVDVLKQSDGCTIAEVSRSLSIHHSTASKYLAILEAEQKISCRSIGMAKVFRFMGGTK